MSESLTETKTIFRGHQPRSCESIFLGPVVVTKAVDSKQAAPSAPLSDPDIEFVEDCRFGKNENTTPRLGESTLAAEGEAVVEKGVAVKARIC